MYGTFTDHSARLGNLFIAIDSAELSNEVVVCKTDQKAFVIKTSYSSLDSGFGVERVYHESFLFAIHHQETHYTGLLNGLNKMEVCVINV
jgi:hypothetical protein